MKRRSLSEELVTYKRTDGEPIGEFVWVVGLEWFEDDDEPTDLIKETWVLASREEITVKPMGWEDLTDVND